MSDSIENISLYIPYVLPHISGEFIAEVFLKQHLGYVKQIDFVSKMNAHGDYYHSIYVHFDCWFDNVITRNFQERLRNPALLTRVMYDDPWFWVVKENHAEKRAPWKPKLRIDLSDLTPRNLDAEFQKEEDCSMVVDAV